MDNWQEFLDGHTDTTTEPSLNEVDEFIKQFPAGSIVFVPARMFAVMLDHLGKCGNTDRLRNPMQIIKFSWLGRQVEVDIFHD